MAEETITILRVGTDEAVRNIADLKNNVKALKEGFEDAEGVWHNGLEDLEIGTKEYQDTLEELKVNQNALKDAMYATSSSMEDVAKAATGASESYNSLVHRMAALKEEFRATGDAARREELGKEIKAINDQLKNLDALQGNFQRNVGNYAGSIKEAFKGMGDRIDALRKGLKLAGGGLNDMKDATEGLSKSPAIATFGILVSVAMKLADSLKDNETAMNAIKKAMASLQPVMDFFSGIIEKLADILVDVISDVTEFVTNNGLIDKVIKGVMGVGNAILEFVIAPFKGIIAAIKVFREQGVKGLGDAARAFGQEIKSGVAFKQNFQAGQVAAETILAGAKSKKKEVKQAGKEIGKELGDGILEGIEDMDKMLEEDLAKMLKAQEDANKAATKQAEERLKSLDKVTAHQLELNSILVEDDRERAEKEYQIQEAANQRRLALLDQFKQDALDRGDLDAYLAYDQERADLEVEIETNALREKQRLRKEDLKDAEKNAQAQKALMKGIASATSSILGTIADLYENDEKNSVRNANRVKNIRIAAATIDTISGAIGAYMAAAKMGQPILGAIQAAAVTAAGFAQIAKIKQTKVSADSASSSPATAIASAPTLQTEVANVRSISSASEEERLNQMADEQRVYILASDIEASQNRIKTRVEESSF